MNSNPTVPSQTISLDGPDWRIATDPFNNGREENWFDSNAIPVQAVHSGRLTAPEEPVVPLVNQKQMLAAARNGRNCHNRKPTNKGQYHA